MTFPNTHPYKLLFKLHEFESDVAESPLLNVRCVTISTNCEEKLGGEVYLENQNVSIFKRLCSHQY